MNNPSSDSTFPGEKAGCARIAGRAALLAVGIVIVALLTSALGGLEELRTTLEEAALVPLIISTLLLLLTLVLAALRWKLVIHATGHRLPLLRAIKAVLATMPLSLVAPSRANDLLRAHIVRDVVPPFATVGSVLAERAVDLQSLCLLAAAGAGALGRNAAAATALAALLAQWCAVLLLVRSGSALARRFPRFADRIHLVMKAFRVVFHSPKRLLPVMLVSLAAWLVNVSLIHTLNVAYSADIGIREVFALWPLALFVGLLPISLGGLGTRDAAFLLLLERTSSGQVDRAAVLASTLSYAILTTWGLALLGLPFIGSLWAKNAPRVSTLP